MLSLNLLVNKLLIALPWFFSSTISSVSIYDEYNAVIAMFQNATTAEIAYSSFEGQVKGYWSYSGLSAGGSSDKGMTGNYYYPLANGPIQRTGLPAGKYIVSYWSKLGSVSVVGTNYTLVSQSTKAANGWQLTELVVNLSAAGSSITVSGTAKLDELRLFPFDAQASTATYDSLVGKTSADNTNNIVVYYEYDEFGRLILTRDQNGNILQTYEYHFKS